MKGPNTGAQGPSVLKWEGMRFAMEAQYGICHTDQTLAILSPTAHQMPQLIMRPVSSLSGKINYEEACGMQTDSQ